MRFRAVSNVIGSVLLIFSGAFALPIATGLWFGEALMDLAIIYGTPAVVSFLLGSVALLLTRDIKVIRDNEGFAAVGLGWLVIVLIGAMPYVIHGTLYYETNAYDHRNPFALDADDPYRSGEALTNAFFESMSGFTTTGASVLEMPTHRTVVENGTERVVAVEGNYYPREYGYSLIMWRAETTWLGGMGIIVMSVVFLSRILSGTILLLRAEGVTTEARLRPKLKDTFAILRWIYIGMTVAMIVLLKMAGMRLYDAICNSFSVIATAGFSPMFNSIKAYPDPIVQTIIVAFMALSAINFVLYYHLFTGKPGKFFGDPEMRTFVGIMTLGCLLIVLNLVFSAGMRWDHALHQGVFNGVSIVSTTGFSNSDFDQWPETSRLILILFMFIGGCAGSTAGALKVVRVLVLFKTFKREVIRLLNPRSVVCVRLGGQPVPEDAITGLLTFVVIYIAIAILSTLAILLMEPDLAMIDALSGVATTMANVGPGLGSLGPTETYLSLTVPTKLWLCGCMWFGRLEIYAALILFFPSTYKT
ncbi:MAG: TrkH family potassium uptake protein [Thermoplasmata archaeon]|nr:TrkH family potassium uptake protein [Thermoplasmata archaeon]